MRKNKLDRELGWLRNVWEELAAIELKHACRCTLLINPQASRGRFYVQLEALRETEREELTPWRAVTRISYPTSEATEFLAWLWGRAQQFAEYCDSADAELSPRSPFKRG